MGNLKWKIDSAESLNKIAQEYTKPWYEKTEFWIGIVANIIAFIALVVAILAYLKK